MATPRSQESDPVPRPIPRRPPRGDLQDEIFDLDSGPQIVETAQDFMGEGLSFEVTGAGAAIDARSGRVSIPTAAAIEGEVVTVTAINSGGRAISAFQVTVEDLDADPQPNQVVQFTGAGGYTTSKPSGWNSWENTGRGFITFEYLPQGVTEAGISIAVYDADVSSAYLLLNANKFGSRNPGTSASSASAGMAPRDKWYLNAGHIEGSTIAHWLDDAFVSESSSTGIRDMSNFDTFSIGEKQGKGGSFSFRRCAGAWAISGKQVDMQALIEWIRSSPSGFRDPTEWPNLSVNGGGSTLSIDAAIPLVQVADGTATLKFLNSALGDRAWNFVGVKEALWVDEAAPYLQAAADLEASFTQGPFLTRKIDLYGGGKIYGGATFNFDKEVLAGRFVNGDWWVNPDPDGTGSPAVLTGTLPASYQDTDPPANGTKPNRIRNGLVKDIVAAENAYDTEMPDFSSTSLNIT